MNGGENPKPVSVQLHLFLSLCVLFFFQELVFFFFLSFFFLIVTGFAARNFLIKLKICQCLSLA